MALAIWNEESHQTPSKKTISDKVAFEGGSNYMVLLVRQAGTLPDRENRTTPDAGLDAKLNPTKQLTIDDLGWTREQAAAIRLMFGSIAEDWDDPDMEIYDEL